MKENILVTVFTPTFNRAHTLEKLYDSLLQQTKFDFEWLIVDDGSVDQTEHLIKRFKEESHFNIRYYKQINSGKHIAINKGVALAKGEMFFIVDSDDYLLGNAIELVEKYYNKVKYDNKTAGISFRRGFSEFEYIGSKFDFEDVYLSVLDFRFNLKISGDMAEVFKTEILKCFPFPHFKNEKFCPESLVWNRLSKSYKILWTSKIVYICNYLTDGLTTNSVKIRMNSPKASMLYYSELEKFEIPLIEKIRANINYWRFSFNSKESFIMKLEKVNTYFTLFGFILGFIAHLRDLRKK